jgi:hypothetical protein
MTVVELKAFVDHLLDNDPDSAQRHILSSVGDSGRVRVKAENNYGILIFIPEELPQVLAER